MSMPESAFLQGQGVALTLRGWTREFLQARRLGEGDYRLWHPDGTYFGRLVTDDAHTDESASGTVFGPAGAYLADASEGRLRVNPLKRRTTAWGLGLSEQDLESPGALPPVERRWPRRD
ncbi:MAG: hypothetical protein ABI317_08895 [Gaiellales bacterium]